MARKTYTEQDRAQVRQDLIRTGLEIASRQGIQGLHLAELTAAVGISKPFFYTFFDSLEELLLQMMEEQRRHLETLLDEALSRPDGTWEEHLEYFLRTLLHHRENGIIVMTQQEERDLHGRLSSDRFQAFRPGQRAFFSRVMKRLDIPEEACPPEVLANLLFSLLLTYNSAIQSMPFLFPGYLEETAELQIRFLVNYLSSLRYSEESR